MARKKGSGVQLSVPQLLVEAQRGSAASHLRYAKVLWELAEQDAEATFTQLLVGMKWFMTVPEKSVYQDRLLKYFATVAAEASSEERVVCVEALLEALAELTFAKDHIARWRACQLVHALLVSLPPSAAISDEIADAVQEALLERLEDAKPSVKAMAVRALSRLPDPGDEGDFSTCPVTRALTELLASEKSKEARKAVLASLPTSEFTKRVWLERTRDEADEVRRVAYLALADKMPLGVLTAEEAALLVRRGLGDRAKSVAEAARRMLETWLEGSCEGQPLNLVDKLGVEQHPEECELVLRSFFDLGKLNAVHIGKMAENDSVGLRRDFTEPESLLEPANALFWRVLCGWLASTAASKGLAAATTAGAASNIQAAAASDRLEALEAALPPTVEEMIGVIGRHAEAGAAYRFATGQLMLLAAQCMDFADATGRAAASVMLLQMLASSPSGSDAEEAAAWAAAWGSDSWLQALALFLKKVYGSPAELADAMLGVLGRLHASADFGSEQASEQAWVHALSVAALLLQQLSSAKPALNAASEFTLRDLASKLVLPALQHQSAEVRREAVRCLGLYCFLGDIPTPVGPHVLELRKFLLSSAEAPAVRVVAAKALADLATLRGVKELDRFLVAELAPEQDPTLDPQLLRAPLLDLLLGCLGDWQEAFAAAAVGAGRKGRRAARAAEQEELSLLGLALVESVARLAMSNSYWQEQEDAEGQLAAEPVDVAKALVDLTLLNFDPSIEQATHVRQALPVFFDHFAQLHQQHHAILATALLPAARRAASEEVASGKRATAASSVPGAIMRFVGMLLQIPVLISRDGAKVPEAQYHEGLADCVLREIITCAPLSTPKPYLAGLCKLLASLSVNLDLDLRGLKALADHTLELLSDRAMRKEVQAFSAGVERSAGAGAGAEPLAAEDIELLLASIRQYDSQDTFLGDYPLPFEGAEGDGVGGTAADVPPGSALRGGGSKSHPRDWRTPGAGKGRSRRKVDSSDDDSDGSDAGEGEEPRLQEESEVEEAVPAEGAAPATASRRMPTRAARSAKKAVVDDSTGEQEPLLQKDEEEEEEDSDEEDGQGDVENLHRMERTPSERYRDAKARRMSADSLSALRQALQENRIA